MAKVFQTISVIGLGYIGLPTAAMFAARRHQVVGVEINPSVVATVNQGKVHIVEAELEDMVRKAVADGFLRATGQVEPADAFLIAVPTPFMDNRAPDISFVESAARSVAPVLKSGDLVVLESTSPVGTTERIAAMLASLRPDLRFPGDEGAVVDVHVAYCPERVLPGRIVQELVANDRIIGGLTPACSARAVELYQLFVKGELHVSSVRTAEMAKLTENAFRDVNIAFANELSILADRYGVDVWELIALANRHPRVDILRPGAGVGGHCIAVDPWFLVHDAPEDARLIKTAREVNDRKPLWVLERIKLAMKSVSDVEIPRVAILGLAFKPDIDDLRESPALRIAEDLSKAFSGCCMIVEPNITRLPPSLAGEKLCGLEEALAGAQVVALLVAHKEFTNVKIRLEATRKVVDAVGLA